MEHPPPWWDWEIELSDHVLERMVHRHFSEAELRLMMEEAVGARLSMLHGRWLIDTSLERKPWIIVAEVDWETERIVVVTAYRRGRK